MSDSSFRLNILLGLETPLIPGERGLCTEADTPLDLSCSEGMPLERMPPCIFLFMSLSI